MYASTQINIIKKFLETVHSKTIHSLSNVHVQSYNFVPINNGREAICLLAILNTVTESLTMILVSKINPLWFNFIYDLIYFAYLVKGEVPDKQNYFFIAIKIHIFHGFQFAEVVNFLTRKELCL